MLQAMCKGLQGHIHSCFLHKTRSCESLNLCMSSNLNHIRLLQWLKHILCLQQCLYLGQAGDLHLQSIIDTCLQCLVDISNTCLVCLVDISNTCLECLVDISNTCLPCLVDRSNTLFPCLVDRSISCMLSEKTNISVLMLHPCQIMQLYYKQKI